MALWPTGSDTQGWMRDEAIGGAPDDAGALNEVTEAATASIRSRLSTALLPVDVNDCPPDLRLGIMCRAAALYMRRDSPTGIVSFSPDAVIRINRLDADVEALIAPYMMAMVF